MSDQTGNLFFFYLVKIKWSRLTLVQTAILLSKRKMYSWNKKSCIRINFTRFQNTRLQRKWIIKTFYKKKKKKKGNSPVPKINSEHWIKETFVITRYTSDNVFGRITIRKRVRLTGKWTFAAIPVKYNLYNSRFRECSP